jgi:hypothetical protein
MKQCGFGQIGKRHSWSGLLRCFEMRRKKPDIGFDI